VIGPRFRIIRLKAKSAQETQVIGKGLSGERERSCFENEVFSYLVCWLFCFRRILAGRYAGTAALGPFG
jgi:hypothetical protein